MLYHASINAFNPRRVADGLGAILGAKTVRAPSPPYPYGAWFVCYGDDNGSLIEVLPWGIVQDPLMAGGIDHDDQMRQRSGFHLMLGTPRNQDVVLAVAEREGWRARVVEGRGYSSIHVWVENSVLLEVMTPAMAEAYVTMFGRGGISVLEQRLRFIEDAMSLRAAHQQPKDPVRALA